MDGTKVQSIYIVVVYCTYLIMGIREYKLFSKYLNQDISFLLW